MKGLALWLFLFYCNLNSIKQIAWPQLGRVGMPAGECSFFVVGSEDQPLFEAAYGAASASSAEDRGHMSQFIAHSALDVVDELRWTTSESYLKVVDRFHESLVSVYLTSGPTRFVLLHSSAHEDGINRFFQGVHELYIETSMNPFHDPAAPLASKRFRATCAALADRHL